MAYGLDPRLIFNYLSYIAQDNLLMDGAPTVGWPLPSVNNPKYVSQSCL